MKLILGIVAVAAIIVVAGNYFHAHPIAVLSPKGPIAAQQRTLIITAVLLMLIIVVPVFALTFFFAWKYRAGKKSRYTPDWDRNPILEGSWWAIPTVIIIALAIIAWRSSHTLDPYKPIAAANAPMTIQVIALDWKWLFIYPDQHLATVNYVEMPVGQPVDFEITADAPMNSFWIPQLGGQIYAMPGMLTHLNLMASSAGTFAGSSANISGRGFSSMSFSARAVSRGAFAQWSSAAKASPALTMVTYNRLAQPSQGDLATYGTPDAGLFDSVMDKYMMPMSSMPTMKSQNAPKQGNMDNMPGMSMQ